jgi:CRP-like cAMP-binding protein
MEKDIALLMETELFRDLKPEEIRNVLKIARHVEFEAEDIIMSEGDFGDTLYVILEGTVEVVKSLTMIELYDDRGIEKNKVFTRFNASQHAVFGEIALLEDMKRTATIKAVTDCTFYEIKKDDFLRLAREDYKLGYQILLNLARIVSARLRKADEDTIKLTTALSIILKES